MGGSNLDFDFHALAAKPGYEHCVAVRTTLKGYKAPARFIDAPASACLIVGPRFWCFRDPAMAQEFFDWTQENDFPAYQLRNPIEPLERVLADV